MASLFNVRLKIKIMTPEDRLAHMEKCKEHNGKTGFHSFLSDTPKWVLDIAKNRIWITDDEYSMLVGDAQ